MSYTERMAAFLEEHKGEPEMIVESELLIGFAKELAEAAEAGRHVADARRATANASLHPKLMDAFTGFWRDVVARPVLKPISAVGLEQLVKQAIATARVSLPATMAAPSDQVFETALLTFIARIKDFARA